MNCNGNLFERTLDDDFGDTPARNTGIEVCANLFVLYQLVGEVFTAKPV